MGPSPWGRIHPRSWRQHSSAQLPALGHTNPSPTFSSHLRVSWVLGPRPAGSTHSQFRTSGVGEEWGSGAGGGLERGGQALQSSRGFPSTPGERGGAHPSLAASALGRSGALTALDLGSFGRKPLKPGKCWRPCGRQHGLRPHLSSTFYFKLVQTASTVKRKLAQGPLHLLCVGSGRLRRSVSAMLIPFAISMCIHVHTIIYVERNM